MTPPGFIPFCRPTIEEEEVASAAEVLRSGWLTSGPRVLEFEERFRESCGAPFALATNSGTAGLHLALAALGVGPGDEVITPSMTWPSAVNVISLLGARPVFADVLPGTLLLDPGEVERRLTERTRAVVPVHYAGQPADLDAISKAVRGSGAAVVEDAAHAAGTTYRGVPVGGGPHPAVFSFHPIKNLTTGEGGMVTARDEALVARMRLLRFHGVTKSAWDRYGRSGSPRYEVVEPGWKYNMLDLQAAIGLAQLAKLERFNAARAALAERYLDLLSGVPEVRPLARAPWPHTHAWHLFVVRLDLERLDVDRDTFVLELAEEGVGTGLHFTPVHLHRYYREKLGGRPGDLPVTEAAGERILSLPLFPGLSFADQDRVVEAVRRVAARHRRHVA